MPSRAQNSRMVAKPLSILVIDDNAARASIIEAGLRDSNPREWVRRVNQEHLERRGIGRLNVAGSADTPVISGRRMAGFERKARGMR